MVLITVEALAPLEIRNISLAGHAGGKDQLLWPEHDFLAIAIDDDRPFLRRLVPLGGFGSGAGPVIQFHYLGVEFEPVTDLVLGAKTGQFFGKSM